MITAESKVDLAVSGLLVVTIDMTDEDSLVRITERLKSRYSCEVLVLPKGASAKLFTKDGVYHREKLNSYEVEIFARTEADLVARLEIGLPKPDATVG